MGDVIKVTIHLRGVEEVFRSSGIVTLMEDSANSICENAISLTEELYPKSGFKVPHFEVQRYTTSHGNVGFNVHNRTPLGGRAQAEHSVLTHSIAAGKGK